MKGSPDAQHNDPSASTYKHHITWSIAAPVDADEDRGLAVKRLGLAVKRLGLEVTSPASDG